MLLLTVGGNSGTIGLGVVRPLFSVDGRDELYLELEYISRIVDFNEGIPCRSHVVLPPKRSVGHRPDGRPLIQYNSSGGARPQSKNKQIKEEMGRGDLPIFYLDPPSCKTTPGDKPKIGRG